MQDLYFDVNKMDLVIENGDFALNSNISEQNGGLLLYIKNSILRFPLLGVGIRGIINSDLQNVKLAMNEWVKQVLQDGGKSASYTIQNDQITTQCAYE